MGKNYVLFVDETGQSDIKEDAHFSLAGVICEYKYSVNTENESPLTKELNKYKQQIFGRDDLNIHLLDIINGKKEYSGISRVTRKKFVNELHTLVKDIDCTIISVTVNKDRLKKYYTPNKDPYVIAFSHLLQSFYSFITRKNVENARIVIEGVEDRADLYVQKAFFDVFNNGAVYLEIDEKIQKKINGFIIAKKGDKKYKSGLELVDILCNPLWRVKVGKKEIGGKLFNYKTYNQEYGEENKLFNAIKDKIYTETSVDDISNWGFKEIPIIENIELIKVKEKDIVKKLEGMEKGIEEVVESGK
ncbi:MAG: DUF3800 domain-containing protein [Clostridium sp.]